METASCRVFYEKLTFIYLEMVKFDKGEQELETRFEKWLYVVKNLTKLQHRPRALQERVFKKLFKIAEIAKFNKAEMEQYRDSVKAYRDMKNVVDTAFSEGFEKGEKKGAQKGKLMAARAIARAMIAQGESLEKVAQYTGLSPEEIKKLR